MSKNLSESEPFDLTIRELRILELSVTMLKHDTLAPWMVTEWDVTPERVRVIRSKLLSRLKNELHERGYQD